MTVRVAPRDEVLRQREVGQLPRLLALYQPLGDRPLLQRHDDVVQRRPGYDPLPLRWVLVRDPLGKLNPAAFFTTDLTASPLDIVRWVVMRWSVEVTFQEVRTHLGFETQRQWSPRAIQRTTPALLGLFSLVVLLAHHLSAPQPLPVRTAAWYVKAQPTFADALAFVRHYLWTHIEFVHLPVPSRVVQLPAAVLAGFVEMLCYSA